MGYKDGMSMGIWQYEICHTTRITVPHPLPSTHNKVAQNTV